MKRKKLKKGRIFLLLLLLIIIGIIIYFIFFKKEKYDDSKSIEIGTSLPLSSEYIENCDSEITWDKSLEIQDDKAYSIGNFTGSVKCKNKKYTVKLSVGDTTNPEILGVEDLSVSVNNDIDLLENIEVNDNSKETIKATVIGDYDLAEVGDYNLSYKACDSTNNCAEEDFTLTVTDDQSTSSSNVKIKYVDGIMIVNKSFPLPEDYVPENLVSVGSTATAIDYVVEAFNKLVSDAAEEGLNIYASTAYRSWSFQNTLYTNYVARDGKEAADTYSARPGYSEHQTGLAIDCNSVNDSFTDTDEGKWLDSNAWKYGFTIRFPKGAEDKTGYKYESWHLRYVGEDLAKKLYNDGKWISLEEYFNLPSSYE